MMIKKNSYITVTDQFCGAGGSSQGVRRLSEKNGGGLEVKLALNHWKLAVETHNTNFPDTIHDCTDISASDPRRYPPTDILITSPECTHHSPAIGKKAAKNQIDLFEQGKLDPAAERSRATMWDVPRFAEYHRYNAIIVENVVEARKWIMFDSWLHAMCALGYKHRCVYLNSMHFHPTPQSRDRMYVVFWKKGNKEPLLEYTPLAHCPRCATNINAIQCWKNPSSKFGKYRQQYVYCCPVHGQPVEPYYYAAFNCIDWSDRGTKISERTTPLSPNTITRISYGLKKYGSEPMMIVNYSPGYAKSITDATAAMTTHDHHGLLNPFIVKLEHSQRADNVKSVGDPLMTQTARQSQMLVSYVKNSSDPLPTQTTCQGMGVVVPYIIESATEARTTQRLMINHGLVTDESFNSFISSYYNGSNCTKHITEETGSVTTRDRLSITTYKEPVLEDCYYRMLKPPEIKLAMAFERSYIILGNGRDQVKQCGNAVTPPVMEWIIEQVIETFK